MNALQFQEKLLSLQDNMMNFALMLTANRDDAQDLLQDTTLKVLGSRGKFTDNVNFKGWVLTIMRNIFINDYHKTVRVQTVIDQGVDIYNVDVLNDSGFDTPDGSIQIQEITGAINSLNEELKVPFTLFVSGYKYNEIAGKLDMPLGTIKSRIFFARQELQKLLKDFQQD
jgi:RNA polymerase sigma-70 factor (ECF subfamily)